MKTKRIIAGILETAFRLIIFLVIISFVYKAGVAAYDFGYRIFAERPMTLGVGRDVIVTVPEDKDVREIGKILRERGLIRDENLFFCQELLSAYHGKLKPGTYTLNTGMTSTEMMAAMSPDMGDGSAESDDESEMELPGSDEPEDVINEDVYGSYEETEDDGATETEDASEDGAAADTEGTSEDGASTESGKVTAEGGEIIPAGVSIQVNG